MCGVGAFEGGGTHASHRGGDAREEAPDVVSPVEGACTRRPVAPGELPSAGTFREYGDTAVVGGRWGQVVVVR